MFYSSLARPIGLSNGLIIDFTAYAGSMRSGYPPTAARLDHTLIPTSSGAEGGAWCANSYGGFWTVALEQTYVITHLTVQVKLVGLQSLKLSANQRDRLTGVCLLLI